MGGGSSSMQSGLDEMVSATIVMGRAISAIAFPGMYRIYDFHSPKAPKLKNARPQFILFGNDSDSEEETVEVLDSQAYESLFCVEVGGDKIYLEDPLICNSAGWTPLHTCCMSYISVNAGVKIIDETVRLGGNLDIKTNIGPGTFNRGWTPLHMACAYGVEPLVSKLLEAGANPNVTNSYGYTPLLEACHRGFINIVIFLLKHKADCDHIPPEELSLQSPFVSSPAQTALGEACRCGFQKIAQELINAGASKNLQNVLGWTPLHEACFYNRVETVKTLLVNGANAAIRTTSGALPYHLTGIQMIRDMISDMGGPGSTPSDESDKIDMMSVLRELTLCDWVKDNLLENEDKEVNSDSKEAEPDTIPKRIEISNTKAHGSSLSKKSVKKSPSNIQSQENIEEDVQEEKLLHSGGVLGDLPSFSPNKRSPTKKIDIDQSNALSAVLDDPSPIKSKSTTKKEKRVHSEGKDVPKEFLCELCQRQMTDPVKSIYGNVFEKSVIEQWIRKHGHVCPLTGAPLSEADITPLEELKTKIRKWILQKSKGNTEPEDNVVINDVPSRKNKVEDKKTDDDDLYDF